MKPAIVVENLSKQYRIGVKPSKDDNLTESLRRGFRSTWNRLRGHIPEAESFWALKDVSFEVQPGEVVGIIGRNGAGKSTLLKILSKIAEPTSGRVTLRGRVSSLLEVGTGFHPELTGRENIYLNGSILGMSKREIDRKFDEIVAFSEIEKFLETPVKRYSSGMYVRLAFAVAAHLQPEILIVDEVLAVGDAEFQKKCLGKMQDVAKGGRTVLFVSHNMQAVSTLCSRAAFFEAGNIATFGHSAKVAAQYLNSRNNHVRTSWCGNEGDDSVRLISTSVQAVSEDSDFRTDEPVQVSIVLRVLRPTTGLVCAIELLNDSGARLIYSNYDDLLSPPANTVLPGEYLFSVTVPPNTLAAGRYTIVFDVGIHGVRRIIQDVGVLTISLSNLSGIGRRFLAHDNVVRPNWEWIQTQLST